MDHSVISGIHLPNLSSECLGNLVAEEKMREKEQEGAEETKETRPSKYKRTDAHMNS